MFRDKFVLIGDDKKTLSYIKNSLAADGYMYIGYISQVHQILRGIRKCFPDLILIDVQEKFYDLKPILDVIEEETLCSCILLLKLRNDDIINYIRQSRVMTYLVKPVHDDAVIQMAELSMIHYRRILDYEQRLKQLNDTLESRKTVDRAKWILIEKEGLTEAEAYESIRKRSRDKRLPMKEIAEAIILAQG